MLYLNILVVLGNLKKFMNAQVTSKTGFETRLRNIEDENRKIIAHKKPLCMAVSNAKFLDFVCRSRTFWLSRSKLAEAKLFAEIKTISFSRFFIVWTPIALKHFVTLQLIAKRVTQNKSCRS